MIVKVFYGNWLVGNLAEDPDTDRIYFEYNAEFLKSGVELSPEFLPLGSGVFYNERDGFHRLLGLFYDSLPDTWGTSLMEIEFEKRGIAVNRFGIDFCRQFETLSDCGSGLKQMYQRSFSTPDNKKYFDAADFYHTIEHLWELGKKIFPDNKNIDEATEQCKEWIKSCIDILFESGGKQLLEFIELERYDNKILKVNFDDYASYFKNNYQRMDYHIIKKNNLPIGTGDMEAAIKKIINKRFKRNNIYWLTDNGNNLYGLACTILNGEFDEFWNNRKNNSWFDVNKRKIGKIFH